MERDSAECSQVRRSSRKIESVLLGFFMKFDRLFVTYISFVSL